MDMLEQMDMMDLSDQDVFLGCGTEESSVAEPGTCSLSLLLARLKALPVPSAHSDLFLSPGHPACTSTHPRTKTDTWCWGL